FSEQRRFREQPMLIGREGVALFEHEYDVASNETLQAVSATTTQLLARFFTWISGPSDLKRKIPRADGIWIEPPAFGVDAPGFNNADGSQQHRACAAMAKEYLKRRNGPGGSRLRRFHKHVSAVPLQEALLRKSSLNTVMDYQKLLAASLFPILGLKECSYTFR